MRKSLKLELQSYIYENIKHCPDTYGCDLHAELFNTHHYIIGRQNAKDWLEEHAICPWDIISTLVDYELDNFGEVQTDTGCPEKVVNMYVYIKGEEILCKSDKLYKHWNNILTYSDMKLIVDEIC